MRVTVSKVFLPEHESPARAGMAVLSPIEEAQWICHPDLHNRPVFAYRFRCRFWSDGKLLRLHVTGDERYVLSIDGARVGRGPDRSDIEHWSFSTYDVQLEDGEHWAEAIVWTAGEHAPQAQLSWHPGLLLRAEGEYDSVLTTGRGNWEVLALTGLGFVSVSHRRDYLAIGDGLVFDGRDYPWENGTWVAAARLRPAVVVNNTGVIRPGWLLHPSILPDQAERTVRPGRIVGISPAVTEGPVLVGRDWLGHPDLARWQGLLEGRGAVTVPPNTSLSILWDLQEYYCAYPALRLSGGRGSRVHWAWDEALFQPGSALKGNRDEVVGKEFLGFGDTFIADGGQDRIFFAPWWRAGRYCMIAIRTGDTPLVLEDLALEETRYPLENESTFGVDDPGLQRVISLCVRGMQMCSHETVMDCPYYEQLMYVGDARLELLVGYVMSSDPRLARRVIELFDYSRRNWGVVNERYPSRWPQLCTTFSLIWVLMLHDFLSWRDDVGFVKRRLVGLRSTLECFEPLRNADGLLEALPGWSFVDWVPEWDTGIPPAGMDGVCGIINLFYALALQRAADLEDECGMRQMGERYRATAEAVLQAVRGVFWDEARGLIADDPTHEHFSEHAQCLGLMAGAVSDQQADRLFENLITAEGLSRATIYFSFYLMETLRQFGRGDLLLAKLDFWRALVQQGLRTPVETPEPTRSDCHAWGCHPLFHVHASLAGIRPSAPGFRAVMVSPLEGGLPRLASRVPHPRGRIEVDLAFRDQRCKGMVVLPDGTPGTLAWRSRSIALSPGRNDVDL